MSRPWLFKGWIKLSTRYITTQWISVDKINYAIQCMVIYPVDNAINPLNNRGLMFSAKDDV